MAAEYVEWDNVVGNEGYRVKWGDVTTVYPFQIDLATNNREYRIPNLVSDRVYYWVVAALVGGVEQTYTAEQSFTALDLTMPWLSCRKTNIGVWAK